MVTKNSTTITLTGAEQTVQFDRAYPYFWVQNLGDSDVFVSMDSGIIAGTDGVITVPAGGSCGTMHNYTANADRLYLLGSGRVQVMGTGSAFNPFKTSWKGGVDGTLSKAGYAADSKVVGDKISQLFDITDGGKTVGGKSTYTISDAVDYPIMELKMYGKSVQDGTPTPDAPVDIVSIGDGGSVDITACGKNLLNPTLQTTTENGVTCTNNGDGTYTLNGAATTDTALILNSFVANTNIIKLVGTPKINGSYYYSANLCIGGKNDDIGDGIIYNDLIIGKRYDIIIYIRKDRTLSNYLYKPMLTTDFTVTYDDFESYIGNSANIKSALPLCGIPVSSGGNYTDSNGQNWLADELLVNADGTGKIDKRTAKIDSYNSEIITTPYISSTGSLTTGATVIYALAATQEIPLTAAEISELSQLQTFNGITNIFNDANAEISVKYCTNGVLSEYVFPVVSGLQKQINDLNAAILSMGSNV